MWAQRSDILYVRFAVSDLQDVKLDVTETNIKFTGTVNDKRYESEFKVKKNLEQTTPGLQIVPEGPSVLEIERQNYLPF